ncbi:methionine--tRNA ligase [Candidatus Palauibacter sp.]|uniref:methionine--tRNA ligase n=1 Tax=Candidatus Palauibacter sp. TaxID=3101350 RepID=UPI003B52CA8C
MSRFYLTTAIDYSNGDPHLGHAIEKIGADAIARYRRARGDEVHFLIGMDEHGQKVQQEAEKQGSDPREWVDRIAEAFLDVWQRLGLSNDDFIRTSEPRHHRGLTALMKRIAANGDFRRSKYEGHYCAGCEAFKKDDELADGRCPLHPGREVEWTEEENWFFRLSDYRDTLLSRLREDPASVRPRPRRNEIARLLESGLDDISASRARIRWGVPFPGDEEHTVYVWFDALSNYITAIGYPEGDAFGKFWPADLHIIGKDITRFHCVYWPAMLLAAGVPPAKSVWAHGFIKIGGAKLSKSAGTELGLVELIERHGPDALRYFLLREVPWDGDRDYPSTEAFIEQFDRRYTSDLANDLGNLLNRVVSMVSRYRGGDVPPPRGGDLAEKTARALSEYHAAMDGYLLHRGLAAAFDVVRAANGFVDESKPWALAKAERDGGDDGDGGAGGGADTGALDGVLSQLIAALGATAAMLAPFTPGKAAELWRALGGDGPPPAFEHLEPSVAGLRAVRPSGVLFPRP